MPHLGYLSVESLLSSVKQHIITVKWKCWTTVIHRQAD